MTEWYYYEKFEDTWQPCSAAEAAEIADAGLLLSLGKPMKKKGKR